MASEPPCLETITEGYLRSFYHKSKKLVQPILKACPFSNPNPITDDDLETLQQHLERIRANLNDADKLAISKESVRLWLTELRELECSAEDVLEEIQYHSLRAVKLQKLGVDACLGKRKRDQERILFYASPKCSKIKLDTLWRRIQDLHSDRKRLRLRKEDGLERVKPDRLIPTSSLVKCSIHGREEDMKKVIDLLLPIESSIQGSVSSRIIPIVGMAGIGKTTLAQHIYNHETASEFETKIWVWASREYGVCEALCKMEQDILKISCNGEYCEENPRELIQRKMVDKLKGKKFLLVLDDMWVEDQVAWEGFIAPLNHGAEGSRIIVTTQSMKVAKMMNCKAYRLGCLSDESCWAVCKEQISVVNEPNDSRLTKIGREIASRCRGSPLAARAVGAVLRDKICLEHWNDVYENYLWSEAELVKHIMPALQVCYDYLPIHLKRCFVYCSLFPKGHLFQKDKIVQLWRAQGFLDKCKSSGTSSLESVGGKYFGELVERCFLQHAPSHDHSEEMYMIHDLYHELAEYNVTGCDITKIHNQKLSERKKSVQHLSLVPQKAAKSIQLGSVANHGLRTLLCFSKDECNSGGYPFRIEIAPAMFTSLMSLRTLDLSNTDIKALPNSVGNLIHLRYLGLERTSIESLPEEVGGLFNLQLINLAQCSKLQAVPWGIKFLECLRGLELPLKRDSELVMPSGISMLTNLQRLPVFVVGSGTNGCKIEELGSLVNLRGALHILGIQNVSQAHSADQSNLRMRENLHKLTLEWSILERALHVAPSSEESSHIVEKLQPHPNLKELVIKGFCGTIFPTWLGSQYLAELVVLDLMDCGECQQLPSLGQLPSLTHLSIQSIGKVQKVGREFIGNTTGFLKLESLSFRKMDGWEMWDGIEEEDFPFLRYLVLIKCPKLRKLSPLRALQNLKIWYCENLSMLPLLSELKSLKLGGYEKLQLMPQVMSYKNLEMLEISCCKKLWSLGNLQQLVSLRYLNISRCPLLNEMDLNMFPLQLENFSFQGSSPLLSQLLSSNEFESSLTDVQVSL